MGPKSIAPGLLYLDYVLNPIMNYGNDNPSYIALFDKSYNKSYSFLVKPKDLT